MYQTIQGLRAIAALLVLVMHCEATFTLPSHYVAFPFGGLGFLMTEWGLPLQALALGAADDGVPVWDNCRLVDAR